MKRYVASGRPRTPYAIARAMGFSKRESQAMVRWTGALVARILAEQELEKATRALRKERRR